MSGLYEIFSLFGTIIGSIFSILDSAELGGYTMLDIFLAIAFLNITLWFVFEVLRTKSHRDDIE